MQRLHRSTSAVYTRLSVPLTRVARKNKDTLLMNTVVESRGDLLSRSLYFHNLFKL